NCSNTILQPKPTSNDLACSCNLLQEFAINNQPDGTSGLYQKVNGFDLFYIENLNGNNNFFTDEFGPHLMDVLNDATQSNFAFSDLEGWFRSCNNEFGYNTINSITYPQYLECTGCKIQKLADYVKNMFGVIDLCNINGSSTPSFED